MENLQPMRTASGSGSKADTSGASMLSDNKASTERAGSKSSSATTTAATSNASKKTWKNVELEALQSKAGIVAGALADFQTAKGLVAVRETTYTAPSGRVCKAVKLFLIVEDADLVAVKTDDGLDFNLVAEGGE